MNRSGVTGNDLSRDLAAAAVKEDDLVPRLQAQDVAAMVRFRARSTTACLDSRRQAGRKIGASAKKKVRVHKIPKIIRGLHGHLPKF